MNDTIETILFRYISKDPGSLIPVLQSVQKKEGYISRESLEKISKYFKISKSRIYGVATFYSQFRFNPPGRNSIKICLGTACHVQGGDFILKALQSEIGISPGETTEDRRYDLERIACLGCCALAPVVMINNKIHSRISVIKLKELLNNYE